MPNIQPHLATNLQKLMTNVKQALPNNEKLNVKEMALES